MFIRIFVSYSYWFTVLLILFHISAVPTFLCSLKAIYESWTSSYLTVMRVKHSWTVEFAERCIFKPSSFYQMRLVVNQRGTVNGQECLSEDWHCKEWWDRTLDRILWPTRHTGSGWQSNKAVCRVWREAGLFFFRIGIERKQDGKMFINISGQSFLAVLHFSRQSLWGIGVNFWVSQDVWSPVRLYDLSYLF